MSDDEGLSDYDKRYVWQLELESKITERCGNTRLDMTLCKNEVVEFIKKLNELEDSLQVPDYFKGTNKSIDS